MALIVGCTKASKGNGTADSHEPSTNDTAYTLRAAMNVYAYQPLRALQIIDSALIVGNIGIVQAEQCRARIYAMSPMHEQLDSLLGGATDVRLDSARAIGERLLRQDTIKADLKRHRDVLEVLSAAARMKSDTLGWLQWSRELVALCSQMGPDATADALRTEAEIGAALYALGQREQGMAKLDSAINVLSDSPSLKFNELDALIIASKRKIVLLAGDGLYAETLPLARKIIEYLDDYEAHPDKYHDGSNREPKTAEKRDNYIRFYRSQAQSYLTSAYASLGEHGNMLESFKKIENSVREATAREHIARYTALQQQIKAEREHTEADKVRTMSVAITIIALLFFIFAVILLVKNRVIHQKNQILVQKIAEAADYKEKYWEEKQKRMQAPVADANPVALSDEELFHYVNDIIVREKLFLDPKFERQTIMDRFQLSKERVGAIFSKGSDHAKLTSYVQQLRLQYAAELLLTRPEMSIVQIATDCGFSSHKYFSDRFRQHFSMTPTEFRKARLEKY